MQLLRGFVHLRFLVSLCRLIVRAPVPRVLLWINFDSKRNRKHLKEHLLLRQPHLLGRRSRGHWYRCQRSCATRRFGQHHPASLLQPTVPTEQFSSQAQVLFQPHLQLVKVIPLNALNPCPVPRPRVPTMPLVVIPSQFLVASSTETNLPTRLLL